MTLFDAFPDAFPEFVTNAPEGPNAGAAPDPDADGVADSNPDADSDPSTASVPDQEAEAVPEPDSEGAVGPIPDPSSDPGTDPPFDLCDDLPRGKLAIQASAGTGKTYALAVLATRFIAETDLSASELLIVTFTRAATNELRAKVRDRRSRPSSTSTTRSRRRPMTFSSPVSHRRTVSSDWIGCGGRSPSSTPPP